MSKTEEEILSKQQYIDRLKEKESEIVILEQPPVETEEGAGINKV